MIRVSILVFVFSMVLFGGTIKIAVAANVSYAFESLKKEFNKLYPNTKVQVILGSSGKLSAQIRKGAPYQLFMSANMKYPQSLYKDGFALTKPIVYAQGSLAILSSKKQDFSQGINIVKKEKVKRIAVANPKTAPYGKAAIEALKNAKIYNDVKGKLIYAETVSQTVAYTLSAVDIGFVAKSALYIPKMKRFKRGINWIEVDPKLYTSINQGIVILKNGKESREVMAFYNFILSKRAKKIFEDFGYLVP
jgi:molybdate transport system substrate-binding protein